MFSHVIVMIVFSLSLAVRLTTVCSVFTGTENPCVWELVHTKSQVEGRPETVFQLCSR